MRITYKFWEDLGCLHSSEWYLAFFVGLVSGILCTLLFLGVYTVGTDRQVIACFVATVIVTVVSVITYLKIKINQLM